MRDVRNLVRSVDGLDNTYLSEWAPKLDVAALLRKATSE